MIDIKTTVEHCILGKCSCPSAAECKFTRCKNCDNIMSADGKTLVDHSCDEWDTCPDCGGPLNERHVYGALIDQEELKA